MTIYEDPDDFGFGGTYKSEEFGSAGPAIACCTIRPYFIDWFKSADPTKPNDDNNRNENARRNGKRRLAEEYYGGEVDMFTPEEFRELFGYEPEMLEGEDDWFSQN